MDKKTIQARLKNLETLKENHKQDLVELELVIVGLNEQLKTMPDDEKVKEIPTGVA